MSNQLNIDNYSVDELLAITKLNSHMPLTPDKILTHMKKLIRTTDKSEIKQFYKTVGAYLIYYFDDVKRNKKRLDKKDDLDGDGDEDEGKFISEMQHTIIIDKDKKIEKKFANHTVKGNKNPNYINTINETLFIKSSMRKYEQSTLFCNNTIQKKELYASSDFIVDLETMKKDVLSLYITDVAIPNTWYVFDDTYGTNIFKLSDISGDSEVIYKIPSGNYTPQNLIQELNKLNNQAHLDTIYTSLSATGLVFSYNSNNNKVKITNQNTKKKVITWYFKNDRCSTNKTNRQHLKLDYNLGILLGFKEISYSLDISSTPAETITDVTTGLLMNKFAHIIEGENVINTLGSTHFFVSIDDYNNNKPVQSITSVRTNKETYKLPDYYNPQTMEISSNTSEVNALASAVFINDMYSNNDCYPLPQNIDNPNQLTQAQKYTISRLYEETKNNKNNDEAVIMTRNLNIPDAVATIPTNTVTQGIVNWSFNEENDKKRIYFGPIRLRKLRIRLYNDKGFLVNLNGADWSFRMVLNKLYQL